ncbi:MAG: hypothetical protein CVU38_14785 [Chloroflexi bacterium HGW-Chloroflexi-1]|nr:MAG: hypothetical protein CVU38_14785 [Chloroflexi bacterium HGW-Chloroflexi-1]
MRSIGITLSLGHHVTPSPCHQFTNLPRYQFTNLPIYQFTNLPIYQFTPLPIYQFTPSPCHPCHPVKYKVLQRGNRHAGSPARRNLTPARPGQLMLIRVLLPPAKLADDPLQGQLGARLIFLRSQRAQRRRTRAADCAPVSQRDAVFQALHTGHALRAGGDCQPGQRGAESRRDGAAEPQAHASHGCQRRHDAPQRLARPGADQAPQPLMNLEGLTVRQRWAAIVPRRRKHDHLEFLDREVADVTGQADEGAQTRPHACEDRHRRRQIGVQHDFRASAVAQQDAAIHPLQRGQFRGQRDFDAAAGTARRTHSTSTEIHSAAPAATKGLSLRGPRCGEKRCLRLRGTKQSNLCHALLAIHANVTG